MVDVVHDALTAPPATAAIVVLGSGRIGPTITALLGLASVVLGARTVARARRAGDRGSPDVGGRHPAALLLGVAVVLLGGMFLVAADGGPGTGNGVVGSVAAVVLGSVAIGLDRLAAMRWVHGAARVGAVERNS